MRRENAELDGEASKQSPHGIDNPPALFMDADEAAFHAAMRADARECLRRIDSP